MQQQTKPMDVVYNKDNKDDDHVNVNKISITTTTTNEEGDDSHPLFHGKIWVPNSSFNNEPQETPPQGLIECMSNVLWSPRLQILLVYLPKAMCSTLRQFFIDMHRIFNPNFDNEHGNISYHKLHLKKRFQYLDPVLTPYSLAIVVLRNPKERFLSSFFDKHVLKRQWVFLTLHNYRKFRVWLDVEGLTHSMENVLRFLETHHFFDVHDCPMVHQLPFHLLQNPHSVRYLMMNNDDMTTGQHLGDKIHSLLDPLLREKNVLPERRDAVLSLTKSVLNPHHRKHRKNALPRSSQNKVSKIPDAWMTMSCLELYDLYSSSGFPHYHTLLQNFPTLDQRLSRIYHQDLEFLHHPPSYHPTSSPNAWNHSLKSI